MKNTNKETLQFDDILLDLSTHWRDDDGNHYAKSFDGTAYMLIYGTDSDGFPAIVDLAEVESND